LEEGVRWADAVLSQLTDKVDGALLDQNPKLKIVANYAVGYNNIDVKVREEQLITARHAKNSLQFSNP
jgi:glyoxylate reductase